MAPESTLAALPDLDRLRERVEHVLRAVLAERRAELAALDPPAVVLVDELIRLLDAGGKRIRPLLCLLGHRAVGPADPAPVLRAAAALELFHLFALIHDDVMDEDPERRGVPSTHRRFSEAPPGGERFGRAAAILVGDLAFAMSFDLLRSTPLPAPRVQAALTQYARMASATAAGQLADVSGRWEDPERVARLKGGAYTIEAPLEIGAVLGGAGEPLLLALRAYARPLGVAFQMRDDALDEGDVHLVDEVNALIEEARGALEGAPLDAGAAAALLQVASLLALPA